MGFQTVRGMRDFLPEKMKKKQFIEDFIRKVFESYGFEPLQTPIVEEFDLLSNKDSGGEAVKDEIYYFKDKGDRELGLRYDLTVPLARVVASNPSLSKPFKRYCINRVFRYDRPQAKRYREFTQADVDIIGTKSVYADFECLQVAVDVMRGLGFDFKIVINNRKVLEELSLKMGIKENEIKEAFRSLDKLDKIGVKGVEKEFKEKGIDARILGQLEANSLKETQHYLKESDSLKELETLLELSKENKLEEVEFDLSLARGLEYYTGNVFEIKVKDGPSVGAGGRYDKLIETYGGPETPATGISFGIDRLYDYLEETLVVGANSDVFVAVLSEEAYSIAFQTASKIRGFGISVEIDLMQRNMKKNFEYVQKKGIEYLIVFGENELKSKKFKIKDMTSREEKEIGFDDLQKILTIIKK
ncbi:MAG: histidine--tRNA ligase [Candidatus Diapherotrites archaeon]|uniref:Histidine--tRNA ligase n=1 Tax=Candidatus Iainarchaeum sp. TaxID=3101447 RepID=A0A2D6LPA9_9ARCH|nr:histidine--tRNA ligase [Candidatus Diapherotrites archaeon]|tara:strand:+ start:9016 stop:10263 length:1248 start_codon:yes stop_codon:yes gene_type:complete